MARSSADSADYKSYQLDSFAQPAIAANVLKQEAERLLIVFIQRWDIEWEADARSGATRPHGEARASQGSTSQPGKTSSRSASALQSLERYRAQIRELQGDLDRKLMTAYSKSGHYEEFLGCYLRLLRESPDNPDILLWARCALENSWRCGRTDEVVRALEQAIQAGLEPKTAAIVDGVLQDWRAEGALRLAGR